MKLSQTNRRGVRAKFAGVTAIAMLAIAAFAGSAQAACNHEGAEQVFSQWGDPRYYVLAPDGGFEAGGEGWSLRNGARVVDGNESFYLNGAADSKSLSLPGRSTASSPAICMQLDTPSLRLFARNGGDPSSRLRVEAVYKLLGLVRTKTVTDITAGSEWAPTKSVSTVLTLSTIVGTLTPSAIELRFTPLDTKGDWQIDDVYVDPFARR